MEYIIEENRIYAKNDDGKIVAEIDFEKVDENTYNIYHTFVDESLRGQGIANELVTRAYKEITEVRKSKVTATCSYASKWLEKNKNKEENIEKMNKKPRWINEIPNSIDTGKKRKLTKEEKKEAKEFEKAVNSRKIEEWLKK